MWGRGRGTQGTLSGHEGLLEVEDIQECGKGQGDMAHQFTALATGSLFFSYSSWALSLKAGAPTLERVLPT